MITETVQTEQQFLFDDVDWEFYEAMLQRVAERHIFVTFDRGRLEVMSPSWKHDTAGENIGLLIYVLAEELNVPIKGGGSTTFRRKDLARGLEPDKCFYIRHEARVRNRSTIDLHKDPPPDLAVEVEISRRLLEREGIYAALGVPELWRYDGERLSVWELGEDGTYRVCDRSPSFPQVPLDQVEAFLRVGPSMDQATWARRVRAWVRDGFTSEP